jgi:hypothetical protein
MGASGIERIVQNPDVAVPSKLRSGLAVEGVSLNKDVGGSIVRRIVARK